MRFLIALIPLALSLPTLAGLNDTGQTKCYDATAEVPCDAAHVGNSGTFPRQDARFGRDPQAATGALTKVGAGAAGFDFTKIGNNGTALAVSAALGTNPTDWACTRDNVMGLIWEVKTASGLRSNAHGYTWYDGVTGTPDGGVGLNSDNCADPARCDTQKFVADVNAAALCGYADWRLPTQLELLSIVHNGAADPALDVDYFPNPPSGACWAAESNASNVSEARSVGFGLGDAAVGPKAWEFGAACLVRGNQ